jgi:hypothetical protein
MQETIAAGCVPCAGALSKGRWRHSLLAHAHRGQPFCGCRISTNELRDHLDIPEVLESEVEMSCVWRNELIGSQLSYGTLSRTRTHDRPYPQLGPCHRRSNRHPLTSVSSTRILRVGVLTREVF